MKDKINELENAFKQLNEDEVLNLIPKYSNIKLADIVITYRYFGLYEKLSIAAMEELSKRRIEGDTFEYEKYIDENLNSLPKLEFKVSDITSILKTFGMKGFVKKK